MNHCNKDTIVATEYDQAPYLDTAAAMNRRVRQHYTDKRFLIEMLKSTLIPLTVLES